MARKQNALIRESLEELRALERRYRGTANEVRIRLLRLLKEDPTNTFPSIASFTGYSEPTLKRWWMAYHKGGIEGLLSQRGVARGSKDNRSLAELQRKLTTNQFASLDEVRQWLGASAENPAAGEGGTTSEPRSGSPKAKDEDLPEIPDLMLDFLNGLPVEGSVVEWVNRFRSVLLRLVPDIDRIMVSINLDCDLRNPVDYKPDLYFMQNINEKTDQDELNVTVPKSDESPQERLLNSLRKQNFPFEAYHAPVGFTYYFSSVAYLGTVVCWRERDKPPISQQSIQMIERLRPFIEFMLSDCVARHNFAEPVDTAFTKAVEQLAHDVGLSVQERRVLALRLVGQTYEQIALAINVSVDTVGFHLKSIYRKTGSRGLSELFARYFTPLVTPGDDT